MNRTNFQKSIKKAFNVDYVEEEVDLLIYLDFIIFMDRLSKEAEKEATEAKSTAIRNVHVDKCVERVLREFRG